MNNKGHGAPDINSLLSLFAFIFLGIPAIFTAIPFITICVAHSFGKLKQYSKLHFTFYGAIAIIATIWIIETIRMNLGW